MKKLVVVIVMVFSLSLMAEVKFLNNIGFKLSGGEIIETEKVIIMTSLKMDIFSIWSDTKYVPSYLALNGEGFLNNSTMDEVALQLKAGFLASTSSKRSMLLVMSYGYNYDMKDVFSPVAGIEISFKEKESPFSWGFSLDRAWLKEDERLTAGFFLAFTYSFN